MFKAVEGIYKKGKIHLSQLVDIGDETRVLLVFADSFGKTGKPAVRPSSSGPSRELRLEDVDVTIWTKEKFVKELSAPVLNVESAFFASKPIDIGHTDANMLDKIIVEYEK